MIKSLTNLVIFIIIVLYGIVCYEISIRIHILPNIRPELAKIYRIVGYLIIVIIAVIFYFFNPILN